MTTRIYHSTELKGLKQVLLEDSAANHVARVLRMRVGDDLILFDGSHHEYQTTIAEINKKNVLVAINHSVIVDRESPVNIHLYQGLCRGEKMDWIVQKAVELGVTSITPMLTEFGNVKLNADRLDKKLSHWQKVVVSACEQSGRNVIPVMNTPEKLIDLVEQLSSTSSVKLICDPHTDRPLHIVMSESIDQSVKDIVILIGPEGGFSEKEIELLNHSGVISISLGARILRTETAPIAVLAILQNHVDSICMK